MAESWPIFICYRQSDGMPTARRIYEMLRGQHLPVIEDDGKGRAQDPPSLDIYFDQAAPGVQDWRQIHEPYLKRARAMILVCTPGSKLDEGENDWVHKELNWWIANRAMAPILIDPLGENERYIPDIIKQKWPDAQRVRIIEAEWARFSATELLAAVQRVTAQLIGGIVPSGQTFFRQEFEEEQKRSAELHNALARQRVTSRRLVWALGGMSLLVIAAVAAGGVAAWQTQQANIARDQASDAAAQAKTALVAKTAADEQNQLLSAQQDLLRGNSLVALQEAAAIRADIHDPTSPLASRAQDLDAVIVDAVNNLAVTTTCGKATEGLTSLQFSPDDQTMVATTDDDGIVRWTLGASCAPTVVFQHQDTIAGIAWSAAGAMASAAWDGTIRIESGTDVTASKFQTTRGRIQRIGYGTVGPLNVYTNVGGVATVAVAGSPDALQQVPVTLPPGATARDLLGDFVVVGIGGQTGFYQIATMNLVGPVAVDPSRIEFAKVFPDRKQFALVQRDGEVWLTGPGASVEDLGTAPNDIRGFSLAADGSNAVAFNDQQIVVYRHGQQALTLQPFSDEVEMALGVSADLVLAASKSGEVRLIAISSGQTVWKTVDDKYSDVPIAVSGDGLYIATVLPDDRIGVRRVVTDSDDALTYYCGIQGKPSTANSVCGTGAGKGGTTP